MAVRSGFWNSVGTDVRTYYNNDFSKLISLLINDGVHQNYGNQFIVIPGDGMQVIVQTGRAWLNDSWIDNDNDMQISINEAPIVAGFSRIDAIAIKIDASSSVRLGSIEYVVGTPTAETPSAPELVDTDSIHWHLLATVLVKTNDTAISASRITNYVGTNTLPFITGIVETINIDVLLSQWTAQWVEWTDDKNTQWTAWSAEKSAEFITWFNHMKDQLDSDAAGHLQNEIDAITAEINGLLKPHFIISADTGSTVTATKGQTTITATETSTGVFECDVTDYGVWTVGGKNLLPYPYVNMSKEMAGITWTVNSDGSISASGTATGRSYFQLYTGVGTPQLSFPKGSYIVSLEGIPAGVVCGMGWYNSSNTWVKSAISNINVANTSRPLNVNDTQAVYHADFTIDIPATSAGTTFNFTVYPMIRLASIQDSTFEPYLFNPVDVVVDDVKIYEIAGRVVPDGRTVTPTDDVQTLLNCANIWDKDYTTLTELMADTTTLASVINSNNAIDYLVRSKTFIKSEALVPVMMSNTTPSGEASASSVYSSSDMHQPYKAFDGNSNTMWYTANNVGNAQIRYQLPSAKLVKRATVRPYYSGTGVVGCALKSFTIKGSHDGTTWSEPLYTSATLSNAEQTVDCALNNTTFYEYYEVDCTGSYRSDGEILIVEIQFYSELGITENSNAMSYIGLNNYASNTLLGDVNPTIIPIMTSDTTPSGQAIASSEPTSGGTTFYAYKAFDGNLSTLWASSEVSPTYNYIGYKFPSQKRVRKATVIFNQNTTYTLQGSNDGSTWTNIVSGIATAFVKKEDTFDVNYQYYRYYNVASSSGLGQSVEEITFHAYTTGWLEGICNSTYFESVLNVKVPTMTSNTTPSGECFGLPANTTSSPLQPYRSFDGNNSTYFYNGSGDISSGNVGYKYPASKKIYFVKAKIGMVGGTPPQSIDFTYGVSDDNSTWESATTLRFSMTGNLNTPNEMQMIANNPSSHLHHRIYFYNNTISRAVGFTELQFYGREDV